MGYNKENFKRIRREYETKALRAREEADARREELYREIPELRNLDRTLSGFGLRILDAAMKQGDAGEGIRLLREENQRICRERADLLRAHGFPPDYSEPHYECDRCRDTGYVGIKMCDCMRRRLILAGMESSGLSGLMRTQSFENFSLDYYRQSPEEAKRMANSFRQVKEYAEKFTLAPDVPPPESLLFLGGTGLGKTHLSTAVARVVIERGYDVFYNSAVGMMSDFGNRRFGSGILSGEEENDVSRYTSCDLLILDDLGTEVVNQFTTSCLYHVINTRINSQLPTIISTNLNSAELRKIYSDRISSRLLGEYRMIPFYGIDVRKQKLIRK